MKSYKLYTSRKRLLADTTTPVSIYLRLRDVFPNSILLESSDYHSRENSLSYVCCDPIAGILLNNDKLETYFPDGKREQYPLAELDLKKQVSDFRTITPNLKRIPTFNNFLNQCGSNVGIFGVKLVVWTIDI